MKAPDLTALDDAGVHQWQGPAEPLRAAATHAHLKFATVNLGKAKDRATLFSELDRGLGLPDHFGPDCVWTSDAYLDCCGPSGRCGRSSA